MPLLLLFETFYMNLRLNNLVKYKYIINAAIFLFKYILYFYNIINNK